MTPRGTDAAAPPDRRRLLRSPGIPRVVWAVTALHLGLLLAFSVLMPALRGPDEHLHVDRARLLAPGGPEPAASVSAAILGARASSPAYLAGSPPVATAAAPIPAERPAFADLGPEGATGAANDVVGQPPLAAAVGAAVLAAATVVPGWPWPFDQVVALLRLVGIALVAGVPLLTWATARRLGSPPRSALTATILVLAVPQLTHVGATVNGDGLTVVLGGVLFVLGARVVTGDDSLPTAVLTGVALGALLLASGLAVVFVPFVVGATLLAKGGAGRAPWPRLATVAAAALVGGGWWWVRALFVDGHLPFALDASRVAPAAGEAAPALLTLVSSFWGGFGALEAELAAGAVLAATVVLAGALGVAFWRGRVRAVRLLLALFVLPTAALVVMLAAGAAVLSLAGNEAFVLQGRSLLPGLVGLMVVAAVGLDQLRGRPVPALPFLTLVVAMVMQGLAVATVLRRYWAGPSAGDRLRAVLAFSPWPPVLVFFALVGVLALAAWTLVEVGRNVRASLPPSRPPPRPVGAT